MLAESLDQLEKKKLGNLHVRRGARGASVEELHRLLDYSGCAVYIDGLNEKGETDKIKVVAPDVDGFGHFGKLTEDKVREFQRAIKAEFEALNDEQKLAIKTRFKGEFNFEDDGKVGKTTSFFLQLTSAPLREFDQQLKKEQTANATAALEKIRVPDAPAPQTAPEKPLQIDPARIMAALEKKGLVHYHGGTPCISHSLTAQQLNSLINEISGGSPSRVTNAPPVQAGTGKPELAALLPGVELKPEMPRHVNNPLLHPEHYIPFELATGSPFSQTSLDAYTSSRGAAALKAENYTIGENQSLWAMATTEAGGDHNSAAETAFTKKFGQFSLDAYAGSFSDNDGGKKARFSIGRVSIGRQLGEDVKLSGGLAVINLNGTTTAGVGARLTARTQVKSVTVSGTAEAVVTGKTNVFSTSVEASHKRFDIGAHGTIIPGVKSTADMHGEYQIRQKDLALRAQARLEKEKGQPPEFDANLTLRKQFETRGLTIYGGAGASDHGPYGVLGLEKTLGSRDKHFFIEGRKGTNRGNDGVFTGFGIKF